MNLIELLGFVIVLAAMAIIMFKRAYEDYKKRKNPEEYEEEERKKEEALKQFLKSLDIEVETEEEAEAVIASEPPPPPGRSVADEFAFERPLEERHQASAIEDRLFSVALDKRYEIPRKRVATPSMRMPSSRDAYLIEGRSTHVWRLLKKGHLKDAILLREIIGPPRHEEL